MRLYSSATASSTSSLSDVVNGQVGWNTVVGEADRAFRQGLQLEKSGQPRSATGAFSEAATLYQCFLELPKNFEHVTNLSQEDCLPLLSYSLVRLGFLNMNALGDPKAAVRLYTMASEIDPQPSSVAFEGIATALEASNGNGNDMKHLEDAVVAYRRAFELSNKPSVAFAMAVALERLGETEEADKLLEQLNRCESPISCLVDSWGYVRWHTRKVPPNQLNLHRGTCDMLKLALDAAMPLIGQGGLVCEFGVGSGRSLRMTQEILPLGVPIHGFDTFTGLPQAWGDEPAGAYSTGGAIPSMEGEVYFHKGAFLGLVVSSKIYYHN